MSGQRRTVAGRLAASFAFVLAGFAITVGFCVAALRAGARDAELLRSGYAPLLLRIGEALADQNLVNAQLNHITSAKNPRDAREWIETARRARPATFAQGREAAEHGLVGAGDASVDAFRAEVVRELFAVEHALDADADRFGALFRALDASDAEAAERARDDLVRREASAAQRLRALRARVEDRMESLATEAKRREGDSLRLAVVLALVTALVGALTSVHARRVLAPLTAVTRRAEAVARGDLSAREVAATDDEIGELARTFEGMVGAIERARAEVVHAERLATIGKMAARVTHEIRNPLSSIGLNLELLEEEVAAEGSAAEASQLVGAIRAEVERLSHLAEQYLSLARRPAPRLEVERVDDVVRDTAAFVRPELERAAVELRVSIAEGLAEVAVDEAQLRQALTNLVRNAREAQGEGGRVELSVARAADGGVVLHVDDDGPGIPEGAAVFDPFFTTKPRGTGLGLAITREIVEAHGGSIDCTPRAPRGTRFTIALPPAARGRVSVRDT